MSDLPQRAAELTEEVGRLRVSVDQLTRRTERAEKASSRNAVALAVIVLLVILIGVNAYQQYQTAARVEAITQKSLCPVFALVIGGYDPDSRPLGAAGEFEGSPRQKYIETFEVMRQATAELGCTGPLVPPRTTPA